MRETLVEFSLKSYSFILPFFEIVFFVSIFVLLPLSFFEKTRKRAADWLMLASYVFGVTTWVLGAGVTFASFGWIGLLIGLVVLGVGVVPLAIVGAAFKLDSWGLSAAILAMLATVFAARLWSSHIHYLVAKGRN